MKKIELGGKLGKGIYILVDDEDFDYLNQYKWHLAFSKNKTNRYATRTVGKAPHQKGVRLHREVMNPPKELFVDHIDGDGLNNQRSNLRICTLSQNTANQKIIRNKTGYRGVLIKPYNRYMAQITKEYKQIYLGSFGSTEEAAKAYDEAAKKYHGEFAKLNFS